MVYARVSKTRGCNDLESSSLSPGTMTTKVEIGDIFEYLEADGPEEDFTSYTVYRIVQQILNDKLDVAAGRVVFIGGEWFLTRLNSGTCLNKMIGKIVGHADPNSLRETE